jgi:hypothetical protein
MFAGSPEKKHEGGRIPALPEVARSEAEGNSFWLKPFPEKGFFRTDEGIPPKDLLSWVSRH